ncbi:MAG: glycosyltransferase family 39 protein, partial [Planctomycetaceae bacterium]|nr:glycosyltransferase family 39 protein [Planctomycetaceae bacterium]
MNKRRDLSRLPGIRLSEQQNFLLVLIASLGMRIFAMLRVGIIGNDGLTYTTIATEILEGRWIHSNRTLLFNPYSASIALLHHWTGISCEFAGLLLNALPGGLAVVPLYFWCRDAFDRRVALTTAWIFALHPILIRYSAPVMRDGLFWFCMLATIHLGWSALHGRGMTRYLLAGFFATCATLNRTEGLVLFVLFTLWAILLPRNSAHPRFVLVRRCVGTLGSVAVFPVVIVALNLAVLPPNEPLSGFERFGFLSPATSDWIAGLRKQLSPPASHSLSPSTPSPLPRAEQKFVSNSSEVLPTSVSATVPSVIIPIPTVPDASIPAPLRTMRQLMDRIRIWNDAGDNMDTDGYYLRSFLTLADEHRHSLYLSMFFREFQHGYRFPVLIAFVVGIWFSRGGWSGSRDLPLLVYALLLMGVIYYHLMKTNIVESRYLLSAIPFVFPWSAVGFRRLII